MIGILFVQQPLAQKPSLKTSSDPDKSGASESAKENENRRKQRAVLLVKDFANRAFSFDDTSSRILSIARFADLLWKEDEVHARQLFTGALELCAPGTNASSLQRNLLANLRREVIAIISNRDIGLAKQLAKESDSASGVEFGGTSIRVANKLLKTQPEQAISFAQRSLESGVSMDLVFFMLRLRTQNEQLANNLYLDVLSRLPSIKCIEPEALILLGTYVFSFPNNGTEPNASPTMLKYIGVGPVMLPDISAERPNVPQQLMVAYLEAAASVLSSPVCPSQDRSQLYAASYLLLNKANRLAPELSSRIALSMQTLRDGVPPELMEDSTYKKIQANSAKTFEQTLAEIEDKTGVEIRDAQYFALVFDLWRRADFDKARMVTARLSDVNLRERLGRLIIFGEAARLLERETKIDEVERIAGKLPLGIERSLLRLGLAAAYSRNKNQAQAEESINSSLRDARRLDDNRVPFLMLAAAGELAALRSPDAMTVLAESVRKLNVQKSKQEILWHEEITCGVLWREWPLEIKGVKNDFARALPPLMKADADVTVETIVKIADERHLSQALVQVAGLLLNNTKTNATADTN